MTVILYHNPKCSKSRQTLALLEEHGIAPEIREYLNHVPSAQELNEILNMLDMEPRGLMRKKESEYKEAGLDDPSLSHDDLVQGMIRAPRLIERPIVIKNGKAAIGRPPENVLSVILE